MTPRIPLALPLALGAGVGAAVARTFAPSVGMALGLVAFAFTAYGATRALRAPSASKATLSVFAWNVLPPTMLFLPTLFGAIIAACAGLVAFAAVVPMIWIARSLPSADEVEARRQSQALGAAFLLIVGALMASAMSATPISVYGDSFNARKLFAEGAPALALLGGALVMFFGLMMTELSERRLLRRLTRDAASYRLARLDQGRWEVGHRIEIGPGPLRSAPSISSVGVLHASPKRLGLSLVGLVLALLSFATFGPYLT